MGSNKCYKCKHKRPIPGNTHISCADPDLNMKGDIHGILNGWFMYPLCFDPAWMEVECSNFKHKDRVFLGGACNGSTWRDELIPLITIDYFNPIVENWTEECIKTEDNEKENHCNIHLYVITSAMNGIFSIAEAVDSANQKNKKTIFFVDPTGFDEHQLKSIKATCDLIERRGGKTLISNELLDLVILLNEL